jgi:hypothetical protein
MPDRAPACHIGNAPVVPDAVAGGLLVFAHRLGACPDVAPVARNHDSAKGDWRQN